MANVLVNNFNSGELGELIESRSDLSKYGSGCKTLENAIPLVEGGAKKMPGTYFAGISANGGPLGTATTGKSRLVPFQFSTNQNAILEFFAGGIRFWINGGLVLVGGGAGLTDWNPATTYSEGDQSQIGSYAAFGWASGNQLNIQAPFGQANAAGVSITVKVNTTDALAVTATGIIPNQGIQILLANATATNNSSAAIQAAIRGLGNLNSSVSNYIDLSAWQAYWLPTSATPSITSPLTITTPMVFVGLTYLSEINSNTGNFPGTSYTGSTGSANASITLSTGSGTNTGVLSGFPSVPATGLTVGIAATISASATGSSGVGGGGGGVVYQYSVNGGSTWITFYTWGASLSSQSSLNSVLPAQVIPLTLTGVLTNINTLQFRVSVNASVGGSATITISGRIAPVSVSVGEWSVVTPTTPGSGPLLVTTPYLEQDLFALDVSTQSADVLYITHPSYPPATLNRYSDTYWTYTPISGVFSPDPLPGQLYGTTDVVKTGYSALGQSISDISQANPAIVTLASSSSVQPFENGARIYINLCAGMVELNQGQFLVDSLSSGSGGWTMKLLDPDTLSPIDSTNYLAYAGGGFAVAIPTLFSGPGNYPACVTLYQQRLCLAGAINTPTQINGSVQEDYPDFICDPNAEDYAIQFTLVSQQLNQIRWMIGSPTALLLGTAGGVWAMFTANGQSLSQTNVDASLQTTIGTGNVAPQLVNSDVIWITRMSTVVRLLVYNWTTNQWEGPDLTRLNREVTLGPTAETSGLVQTAFQKEPYPIFWAVRADGQLIGLTYERQEQVFAWFRLVTDGIIESVACVSSNNAEDQVWVVVNRTINGVSQRYIEYFMPQVIYGELANAFFVHCGLQWNGGSGVAITNIAEVPIGIPPPFVYACVVTAPNHGFQTDYYVSISGVQGMTQVNTDPASAYQITVQDANTFILNGIDASGWGTYASGGIVQRVTNTVTGLQYLQGKEVVVVGDGANIFEGIVPPTGMLTFPYYANLITVGLPFTTIIEPMNPILGQQQQTSKGKKQKIHRATFSLYQSIGGQYGTDQDHLYDMAYGTGSEGLQPTLFTGNITRDLDGDWQDEDTISIVHSDPFPFTLRSVVPRVDVATEG